MKIQVLFGSTSDERVYGPLCQSLEKCGSVQMEVASAHRHPERVREIVTTCGADIFVAGAGLAAHLPGVVASLTSKPVFGVSVNGAFSGLDAFLSVVQMPKGIPVMCVTEENANRISDFIIRWKKFPQDKILLHWNQEAEDKNLLQKNLMEIENQSGVKVEWCDALEPLCLGEIVRPQAKPQGNGLSLLLCEKEQLATTQTAVDFFAQARYSGAWVGANNVTNFVLQWKKILETGKSAWI